MKKLNLIERLWTDSHEKQMPLRVGRYAVMLIMLLTLGVGQMWAETRRFYCKMEYDWWTTSGAAIGAFAWTDGGAANADFPGVRMTSAGSNVWYIDLDDDTYEKIIFCRVNGAGDIANWGAQTGDLTIPSDKNYYTITSSSAQWKGEGNTVTGSWSAPTYSITYKDQGNVDYSGSNSASLTTSQKWGFALDLIEGEKDNYVFNGWYDNSSCTGSAITSLDHTIKTNQTLYAKWTAETTYTITIANNVNASTSTKSVGATPKTITAPSIDDYAFSTWSAMPSGVTRTSGNLTDASISISATKAAIVTANFTLIPVKLYKMSAAKDGTSTDKGAMSYDATSGAYYKEITTDASPYYFRFYYNGSTDYSSDWEGSGVYSSGQAVTANGSKITCQSLAGWGNKPNMYYVGESGTTIKIWYDHQNGKTWITADKDKEYVLRGAKADAPSVLDGMPGWNTITSYFDGLASGNTGTISCTLNASEWYHLKAYNVYTKTWWGPDSNTGLSDGELSTATSGGSGNFYFQSTIAGSYTFTLDKSSGIKMKVDYPVSYTLTYDIGTVKGNDGSISTSPSTSSGSYVPSGNTVTLTAPDAADGYTWSGWFTNAAGTEGQIDDDEQAITVTMDADKTLYACYTENSYDVTVSNDGHGTVSPTGTVVVKQVNGTTLTAYPNTNYVFKDWTIEDGGITPTTSSTNPQVFKATETGGSIQANFRFQWSLVGSGTEFGNWDETAHSFGNLGTNSSSQDTCTVELTLPANTNFTFKVFDYSQTGDNRYWGNSTDGPHYMNYASNNKQWWGFNKGNTYKDCGLTTAGAGTYKFEWNITTHQLRVYFPTSYTVTYGYGTGGSEVTATVEGDAAALSASGKYAAAGKDITFTEEGADGYTFKGWYNASSGGTAISVMASDNVYDDIAANINVYAQYTEDKYDVTLTQNVSAWGSAHVTSSAATTGEAGIATSLAITATPVSGYRFIRWEKASGDGTPTFANDRSASTTVTVTGGDVTVQAVFGSNWVVGGNTDDLGNWDMADAISFDHFTTSDGVTTGWVDIARAANETIEVKVYNHDGGVWFGHEKSKQTLTYADDNVAKQIRRGGDYQNLQIVTAGKSNNYRFTLAISSTDTTLTIDYPTSYTITYGSETFYGDDESHEATTTGGSISVQDNDENALASGKYVVGTGSVLFTATPATNYTVSWYSDNTFVTKYVNGEGGATIGENTLTLSSLTGNKTVYAKFAENMTTVALESTAGGHIEISDATVTSTTVGAVTNRSLVPVADWGYYFAGWKKTAGSDYSISGDEDDEDDANVTLTGLGGGETSGQTLTAKFLPLEKVYLHNMNYAATGSLWSTTGDDHVYAYFGVQDDSSRPKSADTSDPYYIQEMQESGVTDLYAYVPRGITRSLDAGTYDNNERIAFSNHQFDKNTTFTGYEAIYWGSYRQILNYFIPQAAHYRTAGGTKIYEGFWRQHDPVVGAEAGYYLKRRSASNTYVDAKGEPTFVVMSDNQIQCKLRIDNKNDNMNLYMIHSAGGVKYTTAESPQDAEAPTITTSNCINVGVTQNAIDDSRFLVKQTSEGFYTVTLTFTLDTMFMTVTYPVAVGDYRLKHTYIVDEETKTTYSGSIKKLETETAGKSYDFVSMYLNTEDAGEDGNCDGTLKIQKCTSIDASGHPVWSTGTAVTGFTTSNFKDGNGVYVFKVAWDNTGKTDAQDVNSAVPSIISLYDGNYYIKTDYAPGGWVSYHANVMEQNTINFDAKDPNTFDYYHTAWVGDGEKNVKCVIANIYNEALCDTLVGDAYYLGYAEDGETPSEYLPYEASVRFSYNSKTNELKRAYLNGSNEGTADYLYLQGTSAETSRILDYSTGDAFVGNKVKFKDRGNWIYEIDIQAEEGARVKLISDYYWSSTHHNQYMKGSDGDWGNSTTELILGGDDTDAPHPIRVVYDFKTNQLISAWLAGGSESATRAINTNAMIIREHQEQAKQITFANSSYKLTDVDTLYSVMHFNKWTLNNKDKSTHEALASLKSQYERDLFWISFPYDVKLSDVFGFGKYMQHWAIMYYDGRNRAKNGYWLEDKTNWKFIPASKRDTILHAFEGYVLALDLDELGESSKVFELVEDIYLYFPSMRSAGSIVQQDTVVAIDTVGYHCNINRTVQSDGVTPTGLPASYDRRYRDSHWHCIGVPSFHDVSHGIAHNSGEGDQPWVDGDGDEEVDMPNPNKYTLAQWETLDVPYFYKWNMESNELEPQSSDGSYTFQSMYAYLVQYANDHITWSAVTISPKPKSIVERRKARLADDHFAEFNLNIMRDEKSLDHTYVRLTDNENATAAFEFGQDMCKEFISGANIYTLIDELEVAGNSLPLKRDSITIVPVGVKIATNGDYTFSMPEGTDGIGVVLVDNIANTRTNLGLTDYTVTLNQGKIDNRFWLEISPIKQIATDIDNVQSDEVQSTKVRKVMIDGLLYIVREGKIYDARGTMVK